MTQKNGWLTIFTGPPMSGKSTEILRLLEDPSYPKFLKFEGHNEKHVIDAVIRSLNQGKDVIYETTSPVSEITPRLLDIVKTIEVFYKNDI